MSNKAEVDEKKILQYIIMQLSDSETYVVGRYLREDSKYIYLEWPLRITFAAMEDSVTIVSEKMMPFSADNHVMILKEKVISFTTPNEKIMGYYEYYRKANQKYLDGEFEEEVLGMQRGRAATIASDKNARKEQREKVEKEFADLTVTETTLIH